MEINNGNFEEFLPSILAAIAKASVISIDCEFSGTKVVESIFRDATAADRVSKWAKVLEAAKKYCILQLGITCMWNDDEDEDEDRDEDKKEKEDGNTRDHREDDDCDSEGDDSQGSGSWGDDKPPRFRSETYSFVVSPFLDVKERSTTILAQHIDRDVVLNNSTMRFLDNTGFNFTKPLFDGVPYISFDEYRHLRNAVLKKKEAELESIQADMGEVAGVSKTADCLEIISLPGDADDAEPVEYHGSDSLPLAPYMQAWLDQDPCDVGNEKVIFPPRGQLATRTWMERIIKYLRVRFATKINAWKDNEGHGVIVERWDGFKEAERLRKSIETIETGYIQASGLWYVVYFLITVLTGGRVGPEFEQNVRKYLTRYISLNKGRRFRPLTALTRNKKHICQDTINICTAESSKWNLWLEATLDYVVGLVDGRCDKDLPCLVGHNILWDLVFIKSKFYSPPSLQKTETLAYITKLANRIFDTKVLVKNFHDQLLDLDLPSIYFEIKKRLDGSEIESSHPEIVWNAGWGHVLDQFAGEKHHDAGFDSYLTAALFVMLAHERTFKNKDQTETRLSLDASEEPSKESDNSPTLRILSTYDLSEFQNRIMVLGEEVNLDERAMEMGVHAKSWSSDEATPAGSKARQKNPPDVCPQNKEMGFRLQQHYACVI